MRTRTLLALTATATAIAAGGLSAALATAGGAPRKATVTLRNFAFSPSHVTVRRGGRVTWVWRDGATSHNVTSSGGRSFRSSSTRHSGSYTVRFSRAGTYRFECTLHPASMQGVVTVR